MRKSKAFIWLAPVVLTAMLLCDCEKSSDYLDEMEFQTPQFLSSVAVADGAEGDTLYARNGDLSLYINERDMTFAVTDSQGGRWSSAPAVTEGTASDELLGLIQVHYSDQIGNTYELNSTTHSVAAGTAKVMRIDGGAWIEFTFPEHGFVVPVQI